MMLREGRRAGRTGAALLLAAALAVGGMLGGTTAAADDSALLDSFTPVEAARVAETGDVGLVRLGVDGDAARPSEFGEHVCVANIGRERRRREAKCLKLASKPHDRR